jgi:hypothetical protein
LGLLALCLGLQLFNLRGRYLVFTFPYILIWLAHARLSWKKVLLGLLVGLNVWVVGLWIVDPYLHTSDMERIAHILKVKGNPEDLLIVYLPSLFVCPLNYYYDRDVYRFVRYQDQIYSGEPASKDGYMDQHYYRDAKELEEYLAGHGPHRRTWLLMDSLRYPGHADQPLIADILDKRFTPEDHWEILTGYTTFPENTFQLFELKPKL